MEDLLDLYAEPHDEAYPVVCFDEKPYQLLGNIVKPILPSRGKPKREDYEYERGGVVNVFVAVEAKAGKRFVKVTQRRTKEDFASFIKELLEKEYPKAKKVRLVMDNLNTHTLGSLYQSFPAAQARELVKRLETHYTPKHGSWLNMAEIEISALTQKCLKTRLGTIEEVEKELMTCVADRNTKKKTICWSFSTENAREKMNRLYC